MDEIEVLVRVIIIIIITAIQINLLFIENRRNRMVTTHSGVMAACILYFGLIPIVIFLVGYDVLGTTIEHIYNSSKWQFCVAEFGVLTFTIAFHLMYIKYNNRKKSQIYICDYNKLRKVLTILSWGTFFIGGVTFVIYIVAFGGVRELLSYGDYLRSFAISGTSVIPYYSSIMVVPAKLITVTPIVLVPLIQMSSGKKRILMKVVFVVILILAFIYDFSNAGKTSIILLLLCLVVPTLQKYVRHPWWLAIIAGCIAFPLLGILDSLFVYMQKGVWNSVSNDPFSYLSAFSYPYLNITCMGDIVNKYGFRWGRDFITGPLNLIPGINFEASYEVTSEFLSGSNWRVLGGTPNDIITFGYLQFGFVGIILIGMLLGILCGKVDRILKQLTNFHGGDFLIVSMVICIFTYTVNADITSLFRNQFQLYLVAFAILYACRISNGDNNNSIGDEI